MIPALLELPRMPLMPTDTTPLVPARSLSARIGAEVWLKRDDLTGFGLGGNKVRGLEYLLADARKEGADSLITGAGPQSNWAALASMAARTVGLEPHLVYYGTAVPQSGNHLLAGIVDTAIAWTGLSDRSSVDDAMASLARELRASGRHPYVLPRGGATALGAMGYVRAAAEVDRQLAAAGVGPADIWLATGSCSTQSGLVAGMRALGSSHRVVGVAVSRTAAECRERVGTIAADVASLLGSTAPPPPSVGRDVDVRDGHLGPGYGRPSSEGAQAARLVAQTEGVLLDPVFGAKAMGALAEQARLGRIDRPVVFLVSGGAPTLFTGGGAGA